MFCTIPSSGKKYCEKMKTDNNNTKRAMDIKMQLANIFQKKRNYGICEAVKSLKIRSQKFNESRIFFLIIQKKVKKKKNINVAIFLVLTSM